MVVKVRKITTEITMYFGWLFIDYGSTFEVKMGAKSYQKWRLLFAKFSTSLFSHFGTKSEGVLVTFYHISDETCEMCEHVDFCTACRREAVFRGSKVADNVEKLVPVPSWNRSRFEAAFWEPFHRLWPSFWVTFGDKNDDKIDA